MKFDFVVGNPPYQEETLGENDTFAPPVYNKFMDASYTIADKVELIHPARFLFNAGSTPKAWNKMMLQDPHFKVIEYESDSTKIFAGTDIKGGVVISYWDKNKEFGAIDIFTPYEKLNSILHKVRNKHDFVSFSNIVITRTAYRLTEQMHIEHPEAINQLSNGHPYDMSTNIFERLPQIFFSVKPDDGNEYIKILGRENNERVYKFIRREYVNRPINLDKFKIYLPKANGTGVFGETISSPTICEPAIGATETFLSIGAFDTLDEANLALKYVKTKFCRALLSVLKSTQDITPEKWKWVPLQDFTYNSDIDWSKSVSAIDKQLYVKYGLSNEEIDFIETNVKEME
jgi:hypothetical protein